MFSRVFAAGLAAATLVTALPAAPAVAQSGSEQARFQQAQSRFDREYQIYREAVDRYMATQRGGGYNRYAPPAPPPSAYRDQSYYERDESGYDPARYYRSGSQYQERTLSSDDRVYAGNDGRYYCKRSDGTTGLIVGGAAGGVLGNVIDGGHSRIVGTLLGGAVGALAGKAVDQNSSQVRCR